MLPILEMWSMSCIQNSKLLYRNPWMFIWKEKKSLDVDAKSRFLQWIHQGGASPKLVKNRWTMKKRNVPFVWFWRQHDERLLQTINNFVRSSRSIETSFLRPNRKTVNFKLCWIQCFIFSLPWILLGQAPGVLLAFVARAAEAAAWSAGRDSATFQ